MSKSSSHVLLSTDDEVSYPWMDACMHTAYILSVLFYFYFLFFFFFLFVSFHLEREQKTNVTCLDSNQTDLSSSHFHLVFISVFWTDYFRHDLLLLLFLILAPFSSSSYVGMLWLNPFPFFFFFCLFHDDFDWWSRSVTNYRVETHSFHIPIGLQSESTGLSLERTRPFQGRNQWLWSWRTTIAVSSFRKFSTFTLGPIIGKQRRN